jgi:hypothetical protein
MKMYRYDTMIYEGGKVQLYLWSMLVLIETKCGVQVQGTSYGKNRFINLSAKKKWAYPTKEEAFEGFKARKRRQIAILESNLEIARASVLLSPDNDSVKIDGWDCYEM